MRLSFLVLVGACSGGGTHDTKVVETGHDTAADSVTDTSADSDSGRDSDSSGDSTPDTETGWETGDTADSGEDPLADAPVYDCPGPPADALIVEALGYRGNATWLSPSAGSRLWRLTTILLSYAPEACYDSATFLGPAWDGEPDTWAVELELQGPLTWPVTFQGEYSTPEYAMSPTGFGIWGYVWRRVDGETQVYTFDQDEAYAGQVTLCLSALRPDHMSGTLLYTSAPDHPDGAQVLYFPFDLVVEDVFDTPEYDDGTCFYEEYVGTSEEEVWTEGYSEASSRD